MKKLTTVAVATIGIAVPLTTVALAGPPPIDPEYGGKIEGKKSQYFGFDTKGDQVGNFQVVNLPLKCKNPKEKDFGQGPISGVGPYKIKNNGKFEGKDNVTFTRSRGGGAITGYEVSVEGKIDGKRAEGTFEMKTKGRKCKTGTLSWAAKKPSPTPPDPKGSDFR